MTNPTHADDFPEWLSPAEAAEAIGVSLRKLNTLAKHGCLEQFFSPEHYREITHRKHVYYEIHRDVLTNKAVYVMLTGSVNPGSWGTGHRPQLRTQANQATDKLHTLHKRLRGSQ